MTPYVGAVVRGEAFNRWMAASQQKIDQQIMAALQRTADLAAGYAKQSTLYRSRTHGLRSSITSETPGGGFGGVLGTGGNPRARVSARASYAWYVEHGTAPHIIVPRRAKILRFTQNGVTRFARGVFHPGTHARPFMAEAQVKATPLLERLLGEAIVRAFA